ncbi:hypothetical protein DH2020_003035 [Rehmannia glutinosa]|uniref:MADS-box protein n=1 Tax=Rehmannia glutinosa TaxID=99300 RepID=A0ABR0XKP3_REHGL
MHEFTTLCDVSACMIIYGPKQEKGNNFTEPEIWPQNIDEVRRIIDIYKAKNKDSGNKTFGLSDFFHDRRRKIEEELAKLKKKNMESKYPTWLEFMNFMSEIRLREFAAGLSNKAEYVKSRIELLRRNKQGLIDHHLDMNNLMDFSAHHVVINQQAIHYPTIDHHQNSMMMLLMNDQNDHCVQFGGAASSSSGNIQCASYKRQFFYESMAGRAVVDPMVMSQSPKPLARYYGPTVPVPVPVPTPYMQMMPVPVPVPVPTRENSNVHDGGDGQDDIVNQYQMNYNRARYYE